MSTKEFVVSGDLEQCMTALNLDEPLNSNVCVDSSDNESVGTITKDVFISLIG